MEKEDDKQFLEQFGRRIREARLALGLNQGEFAHKIGKAQALVSKYESGIQAVRISEVPAIARALEVPVAYLFGELDSDVNSVQRQTLINLVAKLSSALVPPLLKDTYQTIVRHLNLQNNLVRKMKKLDVEANRPSGEGINEEQSQLSVDPISLAKHEMTTKISLINWLEKAPIKEIENYQEQLSIFDSEHHIIVLDTVDETFADGITIKDFLEDHINHMPLDDTE